MFHSSLLRSYAVKPVKSTDSDIEIQLNLLVDKVKKWGIHCILDIGTQETLACKNLLEFFCENSDLAKQTLASCLMLIHNKPAYKIVLIKAFVEFANLDIRFKNNLISVSFSHPSLPLLKDAPTLAAKIVRIAKHKFLFDQYKTLLSQDLKRCVEEILGSQRDVFLSTTQPDIWKEFDMLTNELCRQGRFLAALQAIGKALHSDEHPLSKLMRDGYTRKRALSPFLLIAPELNTLHDRMKLAYGKFFPHESKESIVLSGKTSSSQRMVIN